MHGYKVNAVPMGSVPDLSCDGREPECPPMWLMYALVAELSVSTSTTFCLSIEAEDFSDRATAVSSRQLPLFRDSLREKKPLASSVHRGL